MNVIRYIFIIAAVYLAWTPAAFAGDVNDKSSEVVGTVTENEPLLYAIVKVDNKKKKLYTKGDIFCSGTDITNCLRIQDIKNNLLILKDVNSDNNLIVETGGRIPLDGTDMVFEKTIQTDVIEFRYRDSDEKAGKGAQDFTIRDLDKRKVVLERDYDGSSVLSSFSKEEEGIFGAAQTEKADGERIQSELFENIRITKIGDDVWSVDTESAQEALSNAGRTLFSVIKKVEPRFRFGERPSLKFNCELGDVVLDKEGFLIQNLAVAKLAERTGIRQGDIIKSINGQPVHTLYGIYKAYISCKSSGNIEQMNVNIVRDGEAKTLVYKIR